MASLDSHVEAAVRRWLHLDAACRVYPRPEDYRSTEDLFDVFADEDDMSLYAHARLRFERDVARHGLSEAACARRVCPGVMLGGAEAEEEREIRQRLSVASPATRAPTVPRPSVVAARRRSIGRKVVSRGPGG